MQACLMSTENHDSTPSCEILTALMIYNMCSNIDKNLLT